MDRNLEINLKDYLDERFSALDCKLNKLDQLRQHEHDIVISMSKDISQQYEEIKSIKLNAVQCRANCDRRKEDFKKNVVETVTPMITSATLGVAKEDGIKVFGETYRSQKTSTVSVDTTVQNLIELTVQSGDASDVFTFYNALIEIVKL